MTRRRFLELSPAGVAFFARIRQHNLTSNSLDNKGENEMNWYQIGNNDPLNDGVNPVLAIVQAGPNPLLDGTLIHVVGSLAQLGTPNPYLQYAVQMTDSFGQYIHHVCGPNTFTESALFDFNILCFSTMSGLYYRLSGSAQNVINWPSVETKTYIDADGPLNPTTKLQLIIYGEVAQSNGLCLGHFAAKTQ